MKLAVVVGLAMMSGACKYSIAPATQAQGCEGGSCDAGSAVDASSTLVCPGSYVISTPQEASEIAQCTEIRGDLTVFNFGDRSLALPELRTVGGTLEVKDNPALESLALTVLEATGDLKVYGNTVLRTLALPLLAGAENLEVHGNPILESLGFQALVHLNALLVYDQLNLSVVDLPVLESIGGDMRFQDNAPLNALTLAALRNVSGELVIHGDLRTLDLPVLDEVAGGVNISQTSLTSIDLPTLTRADEVTLDGNPALLSIRLPALSYTASVEIGLNPLLNLVELPLLARLEEGMSFYSDPALVEVAFPQLKFLNKLDLRGTGLKGVSLPEATFIDEVSIEDNDSLTSLDLPKVLRVGSLAIRGNASLSKVELPLLTEAAKAIVFVENAAFNELNMPLLETVRGSLAFDRNPGLERVRLPTLATIGDFSDRTLSLRALGNAALIELSLPLLTTLTGSLRIDTNATLATLALPSLTNITIDLSITKNPQLPTAQANAILAQLVGFKGNAQIADNLQ